MVDLRTPRPVETGMTTAPARPAMPLFSRPFARLAPFGPLALRLLVGLIMAAHGLGKLEAGPGEVWGGFFASLGIPAPVAAAWVVTIVELVGGVFLIVGFLTRIVGLLFTGVMIGAITLVSADLGLRTTANGPGADLNLALLAGALALVLLGPGRIALDRVLGLDDGPPPPDRGDVEG